MRESGLWRGLLRGSDPLGGAYNVQQIRALARRRVPKMAFDFQDGAAEDEVTMAANRSAFRRVTFAPQAMQDVSARDLSTDLLGTPLALPVVLGPTGMPAIHHPQAEIAAARAAHEAGTVFTVSTASSYPVRQIAAQAPGPLWFQLYLPPDRALGEAIVAEASAADCRVLVLTVDTGISGQRERDIRNGFTLPPRVTPLNSKDIVTHPFRTVRWGRRFLRGPGVHMGTVGAAAGEAHDLRTILNPVHSWADIAWLRERWSGPIVLKGIMTAHDARLAVEHGLDGILVSNHGGRQLDGLPATLDVLPEIAAAVKGSGATVLLDGGVRRGTDVLKALALGADACLVARPWTWGLSAGGQAGVARVLEILRAEIDRAMGLLGVASVREIDGSLIRGFDRIAGRD